MILPAHIKALILRTIAGGEGTVIDEEARGHGAVALMGTIGTIWMLRPDGTFWDADADWGKPLTPLPDELHITALVAGTERFSWLGELLPEKPMEAHDCPLCEGSGYIAGNVYCPNCHALGWLAPAHTAR
jgi:hypothetical protein